MRRNLLRTRYGMSCRVACGAGARPIDIIGSCRPAMYQRPHQAGRNRQNYKTYHHHTHTYGWRERDLPSKIVWYFRSYGSIWYLVSSVYHTISLGGDFFRKYTDMQIRIGTRRKLYFQMLVTVFRWCLMIISCFVCDFVGTQICRYTDT